MIKKLLLLCLVGILLFIIFYLLINSLKPVSNNVTEITPTSRPTFYLRPSPTTIKPTRKTVINDVVMNDFTQNIPVDKYGEYLFSDTDNQQFIFNSKSKVFSISVLGRPFEIARQNAETSFLEILAI